MKYLYALFPFFMNFKQGDGIKCHLNGVPDKICASPSVHCGITQKLDTGLALEQFCSAEEVGCNTDSFGTTCYCKDNNCNSNMASAGLNVVAAAAGGYTDVLKNGSTRHVSSFNVAAIAMFTSLLIGFALGN